MVYERKANESMAGIQERKELLFIEHLLCAKCKARGSAYATMAKIAVILIILCHL